MPDIILENIVDTIIRRYPSRYYNRELVRLMSLMVGRDVVAWYDS